MVYALASHQPTLAFEADICARWKSKVVQWFPEPFLHLCLRILAIDIILQIDVIDLSHQVIEFGEDRDDGYCKMLVWILKDGGYKPFPALAVSKKAVSNGNRGRELFKTKQNLSPQNWPSVAGVYLEIAKLTK